MNDSPIAWPDDAAEITLRSTKTSPFGRKVRIAAHALGLSDAIRIVPADTLNEQDTLRTQNPLGKMPCLILKDGTALYDSRVIMEYLDSLSGEHMLIPREGMERYEALTRAVFEREPIRPDVTNIVSISLACALGYLDWRKPVEWRDNHSWLVYWLDSFAVHQPAFLRTDPLQEIP